MLCSVLIDQQGLARKLPEPSIAASEQSPLGCSEYDGCTEAAIKNRLEIPVRPVADDGPPGTNQALTEET